MSLYVEEDISEFLDQTLNFVCCFHSQSTCTCTPEYCWRIMLSTGVTVARGLEITNNHVTITKMHSSTIFYQSTTQKTLTTKSSIELSTHFYVRLSCAQFILDPTQRTSNECSCIRAFHNRILSSLHIASQRRNQYIVMNFDSQSELGVDLQWNLRRNHYNTISVPRGSQWSTLPINNIKNLSDDEIAQRYFHVYLSYGAQHCAVSSLFPEFIELYWSCYWEPKFKKTWTTRE